MSDSKSKIFSALEVAKICGVVNQTAINWIKNGFLKAFKTPGGQFRVYPEDLVNFMKSRNMEVPASILEFCKDVDGGKKLMIVDDDKGLNTVILNYIKSRNPNLEIFQAFDGFEAGLLLSEKKPNCIILDLNLPGVNGIELCKKIKGDEKYRDSKIIVITSLENLDTETQLRSLGIVEYIKKPANLVKIEELVRNSFE